MSKRAELEPKLSYFLQLEKTPNSIARLCSYAKPILDAVGIQLDLRGLFQWVVSPDGFTHTPIPGPGPLNDHNAIKRLFLLANSGQSYVSDSTFLTTRSRAERARASRRPSTKPVRRKPCLNRFCRFDTSDLNFALAGVRSPGYSGCMFTSSPKAALNCCCLSCARV